MKSNYMYQKEHSKYVTTLALRLCLYNIYIDLLADPIVKVRSKSDHWEF